MIDYKVFLILCLWMIVWRIMIFIRTSPTTTKTKAHPNPSPPPPPPLSLRLIPIYILLRHLMSADRATTIDPQPSLYTIAVKSMLTWHLLHRFSTLPHPSRQTAHSPSEFSPLTTSTLGMAAMDAFDAGRRLLFWGIKSSYAPLLPMRSTVWVSALMKMTRSPDSLGWSWDTPKMNGKKSLGFVWGWDAICVDNLRRYRESGEGLEIDRWWRRETWVMIFMETTGRLWNHLECQVYFYIRAFFSGCVEFIIFTHIKYWV